MSTIATLTSAETGAASMTDINANFVALNADKQETSGKDATGGYAGLTLFKINFKNAANTFTNFFTNATTAARTYTFQNRDGTIADDTDLALKAPLASPTFTGKPVLNAHDITGATYTPASGSQTVAIDCASNNMHVVTGNASGTAITFTVANATNNQPFVVSILQGSGTVSTIAGWFATVRWVGGATPTLTATLNKRDTFGFIRTGTNTYDGFVIGQNC